MPPASSASVSFEALTTPSADAVRLWDLVVQGSGPERVVAASLAWTGSEVDGWRRIEGPVVTWTSPVLLDEPVPDAVEIDVIAGDAAWLDVVASPHQVPTSVDDRMRTQRVPLSGGDAVVTVRLPIATVLHENWGDEANAPRLARLVLRTPPGSRTARVTGVRLQGELWEQRGEPVLTGSFDVHGVRRPGWFLGEGSHASVRVTLPDVGPRFTAAVAGDATASLTIDGQRVGQLAPTDAWSAWQVDLSAWAGQTVTLDVGASDGDILVGAPRVARADQRATNVLVYVVDTLRADHVGWQSTETSLTPNLDALAETGVAFAQTQSTGTWTKPVIPTVLTGLGPLQHGVGLRSIADRLPPDVPTLAHALGAAGYRTGSFSASPMGSTLSGLEQGFDVAVPPVFWAGQLTDLGHPRSLDVHEAMLRWVDSVPDAPWLAYVHVLEPHAHERDLYASGQPTPYAAAVRDWDDQLGAFIDALEARGELADTLVVVLSDHGESFGEHGLMGHGTGVVPQQTRVPLLLWHSTGLGPGVVVEPASLADVTPTVLDLLGLDALPETLGIPLTPALQGRPLDRAGVGTARMRYVARPEDPAQFAWLEGSGVLTSRRGTTVDAWDLSLDPCAHHSAPVSETSVHTMRAWQESEQHGWRRSTVQPMPVGDAVLLSTLGYLDR